MEIVGLSGYARTGKDEVAKILVDVHGFTRVAFADKLREVLYALNPQIGRRWFKKVYIQEVIDKYSWDGYKETRYSKGIRRLLQRLGTEAGRRILGENIWVDAAFEGLPQDARVVVTDCRFPNEAAAITERGGAVWRIERPGVGPINSHASETGLDDWIFDATINNDGTLMDLRGTVNKHYILRKP